MTYRKLKIEVRGITAMTSDGTIGVDNELPWAFGEQRMDMKRFRDLTTGHIVAMGKNTWLSMGAKSLPRRNNIIVTHDALFPHDAHSILANSMEQMIDIAEALEESNHSGEPLILFIIGGSEIYRQAIEMSIVSRFHVSYIAKYLKQSPTSIYTKFPNQFPILQWGQENEEFFNASEGNVSAGRFVDYVLLESHYEEAREVEGDEEAFPHLYPLEKRDNGWIRMADAKPENYGEYEVYRAKCKKQHYRVWNNTGWAYDNADITHWRPKVPPSIM
jgi:dihydrofolate reductase